ncbi:DUF6875 domain-containing protein [Micromonospora krabiensis]|uniref:DUF6875 domain-containing protein n=1 Tax=Micromonospora krabiensis TaxID=307121 RepID=A0A1C3MWH1_9ACTN|nr:hypothetical protein [Micromonospora krabiensis]SBV24677.1 hypothetical protein GA0070620_0109 [Micromonospora krabiensis]
MLLGLSGLALWSPAEVADGNLIDPEQLPALRETAAWAERFLTYGHADLGRQGPVCPYTRPSLNRRLFHLACLDRDLDDEGVRETLLGYRDLHQELAAELPQEDRQFLTILIVLPRVDRSDPEPLNRLQARLKTDFVQNRLMIGQFHPECAEPGLWNRDFRPLHSPVPLLAIRHMVAFDLPFLQTSQQHLEAYLAAFAPAIPTAVRSRLAELATREIPTPPTGSSVQATV